MSERPPSQEQKTRIPDYIQFALTQRVIGRDMVRTGRIRLKDSSPVDYYKMKQERGEDVQHEAITQMKELLSQRSIQREGWGENINALILWADAEGMDPEFTQYAQKDLQSLESLVRSRKNSIKDEVKYELTRNGWRNWVDWANNSMKRGRDGSSPDPFVEWSTYDNAMLRIGAIVNYYSSQKNWEETGDILEAITDPFAFLECAASVVKAGGSIAHLRDRVSRVQAIVHKMSDDGESVYLSYYAESLAWTWASLGETDKARDAYGSSPTGESFLMPGCHEIIAKGLLSGGHIDEAITYIKSNFTEFGEYGDSMWALVLRKCLEMHDLERALDLFKDMGGVVILQKNVGFYAGEVISAAQDLACELSEQKRFDAAMEILRALRVKQSDRVRSLSEMRASNLCMEYLFEVGEDFENLSFYQPDGAAKTFEDRFQKLVDGNNLRADKALIHRDAMREAYEGLWNVGELLDAKGAAYLTETVRLPEQDIDLPVEDVFVSAVPSDVLSVHPLALLLIGEIVDKQDKDAFFNMRTLYPNIMLILHEASSSDSTEPELTQRWPLPMRKEFLAFEQKFDRERKAR